MTDLHQFYKARTEELAAQIAVRKRRSRMFVAAEIVSFLAVIGFVAAYTSLPGGWLWLVLSALSLAVYITIRKADVKNSAATDRLRALHTVNRHELKYLEGDFSPFDDGSCYTDPRHPFTFDMDIFGRGSLYNRICRTATTGGADCLARSLSNQYGKSLAVETGDGKNIVERIESRRQSVDFLASMTRWREEFIAEGTRTRADSALIGSSLAAVRSLDISAGAASKGALGLAAASLAGFYAVVALAVFAVVPGNVAVAWGTLQLFGCLLLCQGPLKRISTAVDKLHSPMKTYVRLASLAMRLRPSDDNPATKLPPELSAIAAELDGALVSFRQIEDITARLDRRANLLGLVFLDALMLSDFFLVRRFLRWKNDFAEHIDRWIGAVSRLDAIVSMATFRHNEPSSTSAEIVDSDDVVYEARALYHPFLGPKAVKNDFVVKDSNYYIITGANMAGKSTFLRTIGVNYILAVNGMPVFADSLRVSVFALFTSMRTTDDLTRGISYFNAELLRLKQLIADCASNTNMLIILDEILKGTNSADKLNGSRLFLEYILKKRVTGIIATHDLELSKMEQEHPDRFHNYCFEIELGRDVTYTYKITPGVARNQNATFLLRGILGE